MWIDAPRFGEPTLNAICWSPLELGVPYCYDERRTDVVHSSQLQLSWFSGIFLFFATIFNFGRLIKVSTVRISRPGAPDQREASDFRCFRGDFQ